MFCRSLFLDTFQRFKAIIGYTHQRSSTPRALAAARPSRSLRFQRLAIGRTVFHASCSCGSTALSLSTFFPTNRAAACRWAISKVSHWTKGMVSRAPLECVIASGQYKASCSTLSADTLVALENSVLILFGRAVHTQLATHGTVRSFAESNIRNLSSPNYVVGKCIQLAKTGKRHCFWPTESKQDTTAILNDKLTHGNDSEYLHCSWNGVELQWK